jgi:hypothetical protein
LFSLFLVVATLLVGIKTYLLWKDGPWDLPEPGKGKAPLIAQQLKQETIQSPMVSTETIVSRNLFDPERGAGAARETEASSLAYQRIRNIVLLGTAILGTNRYAILLQPADAQAAGPRAQAQPREQLRYKLGDSVEGFKLSEINEKDVVFTKGAARVEVALDYFRKFEEAKPAAAVRGRVRAPGQVRGPGQTVPRQMAPRVIPNIPRRQRSPASPSP